MAAQGEGRDAVAQRQRAGAQRAPAGGRGSDAGDAVAEAMAFVLRSTKARPQTEAELRAKLRGRAHADHVVDAAIERAKGMGAIDDVAFAKAWVNDRGVQRGFSATRIRGELQRRGVAEPVIDAAVDVLATRDDAAVATELARKRAQQMPATLTPEVVARRLVGFLGRRGYSEGLAVRVAAQVSGLDREWD